MNINILGRRERGEQYDEQIDVYEDDAERLYESFNDLYDDFGEGRSKTPFVIIGALLAVAIVGGGLAFAYKRGISDGGDGPAIIEPDRTAAKIEPVDPGGIDIPHQDRQIYQQVTGQDADTGAEEVVSAAPPPENVTVPRAVIQPPSAPSIEVAAVPPAATPAAGSSAPAPAAVRQPNQAASPPPQAPRNPGPPTIGELASRVAAGQPVPSVAAPPPAVNPGGSAAVAAPAPGAGAGAPPAFAPRQVRTVTIGPDGNIVESAPAPEPDAEAIATAARQLAPRPGETPTTSPPGGAPSPAAGSAVATAPSAQPTPASSPAGTSSPNEIPILSSEEEAAAFARGQNPGGTSFGGGAGADGQTSFFAPSPRPKPRPTTPAPAVTASPAVPAAPVAAPAGAPSANRGQILQTALAPSTNGRPRAQQQPPPAASRQASAPPPAARAASGAGGGYAVQVASHRQQAEAVAAFADLQQRYPSLMTGMQPLIQRADLGDRGIYFRLRIGPIASKGEADRLCSSLQSAGLAGCLVREL